MPLADADIQKIASILGEVLAPQIRETVRQQTSVRVDAALAGIHAELAGASVAAVRDLESRFDKSAEQSAAALRLLTETLDGLRADVAGKPYHQLILDVEALKVGLTNQAEHSGAGNFVLSKRIEEVVGEVTALIPDVPAPLELVVNGELGPEVRVAMQLAAKQIFQPMLDSVARGAAELVSDAARGAAEATEAAELRRVQAMEHVALTAGKAAELYSQQAMEHATRIVAAAEAKAAEAAELHGRQAIEHAARIVADAEVRAAEAVQALREALEDGLGAVQPRLDSIAKGAAEAAELRGAQAIEHATRIVADAEAKAAEAAQALREVLEDGLCAVNSELLEVRKEAHSAVDVLQTSISARLEDVLAGAVEDKQDVCGFIETTRVASAAVQEQLKVLRGEMCSAARRIEDVRDETVARTTVEREAQTQALHELLDTRIGAVREDVNKAVDAAAEVLTKVATKEDITAMTSSTASACDAILAKAHAEVLDARMFAVEQATERAAEVRSELEDYEQHDAEISTQRFADMRSSLQVHIQAVRAVLDEAIAAFDSAIPAAESAAVVAAMGYMKVAAPAAESAAIAAATGYVQEALPAAVLLQADALAAALAPQALAQATQVATDTSKAILGAAIADAETAAGVRLAAFSLDLTEKTLQAARVTSLATATAAGAEAGTSAAAQHVKDATDALAEQVLGAIAPEVRDFAAKETERLVTDAHTLIVKDVDAKMASAADERYAGVRKQLEEQLDPAPLITQARKDLLDALQTVVRETIAEGIDDLEPRLLVRLTAKIQDEIDRIPRPRDGKNGTAGHDGTDARIVPAVPYAVGRAYERGDWVAHKRGVWCAGRNTEDEPGVESKDWDCIVPGLARIESLVREDGRTLELHFEMTDGTFQNDVLTLAIPVPRGVYAPEAKYAQHDVVTFNGGWWEAKKDGVLGRPGTNTEEWRLSIKSGKDGIDKKPAAPPVLKYAGSWEMDKLYEVNQVVEHAGVNWLAMKSTRERPPFTTLISNESWLKLGT